MIPVIAGNDLPEVVRLLSGLAALGVDSEIIETDRLGQKELPGPALVHVSKLRDLGNLKALSSFIVFGGDDTAASAVQSLRKGACEYFPHGTAIENFAHALAQISTRSKTDPATVAVSEKMCRLVALAQRVAQADIAVLIAGESGTGKEVIARHIHNTSNRAEGPFIAVNCAAIPETMLEAVLFGHDKGAFTGASEKRLGKFELADGGTLLLDEITEMPLALQAKLLRVLQEQEVERIGSNRPKKINVRVLATSNRNLQEAVADGYLREDLYYRLSVFPLSIPPLRERYEDILPLAEFFLSKHGGPQEKRLSADANAALVQHRWPGNVRELENCIQRALVMSDTCDIEVEHLGIELGAQSLEEEASLQVQLRNQEEQLLLRTLAENNGVRKATAAQLGISERTLRHKLKQLRERGLVI